MSERGISDLVGFTLMFSIIIMSVAIVTTAGVTQLSELSEREGINSAERGMEAFAGSADDLLRHGDFVRGATLSPSGGLVWLNDTSLGVRVVDNGTGNVPPGGFDQTGPDAIEVNATEHRFSRNPEDVSVVYESGTVLRSDGGGAIARPQWECSDDTAVLTAVKLRPGEGLSIGSGFGSGTGDLEPTAGDEVIRGDIESTDSGVRFQLARTKTEVYTENGGSFDLEVNPEGTATPAQWQFFFEQSDQWLSPSGDFYRCPDVSTVVVRVVSVDVST